MMNGLAGEIEDPQVPRRTVLPAIAGFMPRRISAGIRIMPTAAESPEALSSDVLSKNTRITVAGMTTNFA